MSDLLEQRAIREWGPEEIADAFGEERIRAALSYLNELEHERAQAVARKQLDEVTERLRGIGLPIGVRLHTGWIAIRRHRRNVCTILKKGSLVHRIDHLGRVYCGTPGREVTTSDQIVFRSDHGVTCTRCRNQFRGSLLAVPPCEVKSGGIECGKPGFTYEYAEGSHRVYPVCHDHAFELGTELGLFR